MQVFRGCEEEEEERNFWLRSFSYQKEGKTTKKERPGKGREREENKGWENQEAFLLIIRKKKCKEFKIDIKKEEEGDNIMIIPTTIMIRNANAFSDITSKRIQEQIKCNEIRARIKV